MSEIAAAVLLDHPADAPACDADRRVHQPDGRNLRRKNPPKSARSRSRRDLLLAGRPSLSSTGFDHADAACPARRVPDHRIAAPRFMPKESPTGRDREKLFRAFANSHHRARGPHGRGRRLGMWMAEALTPAIAEAISEAMRRRESVRLGRALAILDKVSRGAGLCRRVEPARLHPFPQGDRWLPPRHRAHACAGALHFAALSGQALILMQQGRIEAGQTHSGVPSRSIPGSKERTMLIPARRGHASHRAGI